MVRKGTLLVLAAILALASDAQAQRRSPSPRSGAAARGAPAVSLEVSGGQGTFLGLWGRVAEAVSLGVEAELQFAQEEGEEEFRQSQLTSSRLGAGASVKWFLTPRESVTPFLYGHAGITRESAETTEAQGEVDVEGTRALVRGAVGLEWFAGSRFSAGANVGARWRSGELERESGTLRVRQDVDQSLLEIFTSGISATFHF